MVRKAVRTAVRLIGGTGRDSSTVVVGAIKPKALSDFAVSTLKLENGCMFEERNEIKIVDFVKAYRSREINGEGVDENEVKVIEQCIGYLMVLNQKYVKNSSRYREKEEKKEEKDDLDGSKIVEEEKDEKEIVKVKMKINDYINIKEELRKTEEYEKGVGSLLGKFEDMDKKIDFMLRNNEIDVPLVEFGKKQRNAENEFSDNRNNFSSFNKGNVFEGFGEEGGKKFDLQLSVLGQSFGDMADVPPLQVMEIPADLREILVPFAPNL